MVSGAECETPRAFRALLLLTWFVAPMPSLAISGVKVVDIALVLALVGSVLLVRPSTRPGTVYVPKESRRVLCGVALIAVGSVAGAIRLGDSPAGSVVANALWAAAPLVLLLRVRVGSALRASMARAYVWGVALSVVAALARYAGAVRGGGRWQGLTTHPNQLAMTIVLAIALLAFMFPAVRQRIWLQGGLLALFLFTIARSGSRSGAVGAVVVLGLLAIRWCWSRPRRAILAVTLSVCAVVFVASLDIRPGDGRDVVSRTFGSAEDVARSDESRSALIDEALTTLNGPAAVFGGAELDQGLHNALVQTWITGGLLALAGMGLILIVPVRSAWRGLRRATATQAFLFSVSSVGWVAVVLFNNAFWARFAWCVIALAVVATTAERLRAAESGSNAATEGRVPDLSGPRRPVAGA